MSSPQIHVEELCTLDARGRKMYALWKLVISLSLRGYFHYTHGVTQFRYTKYTAAEILEFTNQEIPNDDDSDSNSYDPDDYIDGNSDNEMPYEMPSNSDSKPTWMCSHDSDSDSINPEDLVELRDDDEFHV